MSEVNEWGGSDAQELFMDANYRPERPHGPMEGRLGMSVSFRRETRLTGGRTAWGDASTRR